MEESFLDRLKAGFKDRMGEGREDYRQAYYAAREMQGKDPEDVKIKTMLATNPTFVTARDLLGNSDPIYRGQREERGMGLSNDRVKAVGQILGTLGNDIVNDSTRNLYWLLNAPQASANVIQEYALAQANPDLYSHTDTGIRMPVMDGDKPKVYKDAQLTRDNRASYDKAVAEDLISKEGTKRKGVSYKDGMLTRRKYNPGDVAALGIPAGIAINAGIGLLNPLGGSGGYAAAIPSAEDPSKTQNAILEVAAKYIMGRTGNLLDYDEFSQHRPDVSREDYNKYKAFKYDKEVDLNPFDDGQVTLPAGLAKFTMEGIHGPELQFLGRSLPAATTLAPFLGAVAGGVAGVRTKRPIKGGLLGGTAGLAVGSGVGIIAEELRRRAASNVVQETGGNAETYLGN